MCECVATGAHEDSSVPFDVGIWVIIQAPPNVVSVELGFLEESCDVVIIQAVLNLVAVAAGAFHQTTIPQQPQLMGYG